MASGVDFVLEPEYFVVDIEKSLIIVVDLVLHLKYLLIQ